MKLIRYIMLNGAFSASIYYGLFHGVEMAANIAYFFAWTVIVLSFFALSDEAVKRMSEAGRSVPSSVNSVFDMCVTLAFAAAGAWVTAVFYLLHYFLIQGAWAKSIDLKEATND